MFLAHPITQFSKFASGFIFSMGLILFQNHHAQSAEPQIAVVDMNSAAKQLGKVEEVTEQLRQRHEVLKARLEGLQESYAEEYRQAEALYGDGRTIEQTQRLAALQHKLKLEWENALKISGEDIETFKTELLVDFRKEIGNIVMVVAKEEGFHVVFDSGNTAVLAFTDQVDLTAKVVERYRQLKAEKNNEKVDSVEVHSFETSQGDELEAIDDDATKPTEP